MYSTYKTAATCTNCGLRFEYDIPKGVPVRDEECRDCGCKALVVVKPKPEIRIRMPEEF